MFLLSFLATAAYAGLPTWTWEYDRPINYYLRTEYRFAETLFAPSRQNSEARAGAMVISAETTCTPKKLGKNVEFACTFSYLKFSGEPTAGSTQSELDAVFQDWNDYIAPVKASFVLRADGKLTEFDISELKRKSKRDGDLIELFRTYLMRTFSPLDFPLTTNDKDWIRGWEDNSLGLLLQLPFSTGTAGAGTLTSKYETERFGLYQVFSEGRATVGAGGAVDASANGGLVDLRVAAEAWVDPAGTLLSRGYSTDGQRIASSSTVGSGHYIQQTSAAQRVSTFNADHSPPLSVMAQRAPKLAVAHPAAPDGVQTVEFSTLGMDPLFIQGLPQVATGYDLPVSSIKAFVVVNTDGKAEKATAWDGYEMLAEHVERGLAQAKFPVKDHFYAVEVSVEVRP